MNFSIVVGDRYDSRIDINGFPKLVQISIISDARTVSRRPGEWNIRLSREMSYQYRFSDNV